MVETEKFLLNHENIYCNAESYNVIIIKKMMLSSLIYVQRARQDYQSRTAQTIFECQTSSEMDCVGTLA